MFFFGRLWRSCAVNLKHNLHLHSTLDFSARTWKTSWVFLVWLTITPVFGLLVMSLLTEFQSHSEPLPCVPLSAAGDLLAIRSLFPFTISSTGSIQLTLCEACKRCDSDTQGYLMHYYKSQITVNNERNANVTISVNGNLYVTITGSMSN